MTTPKVNIIAALICWFACVSFASSQQLAVDPTQLTANELLQAGRQCYDSGDWAQAELLFQSFLDQYGSTPEATDTARRMRGLLVISKLRQKKYEDSLELLEQTLQDPNLDPPLAEELSFWRGICHLQTNAPDKAREAFQLYHEGKLPFVAKLAANHQTIHLGRKVEAILLHAVCLILQEDHLDAAEFLGQYIPKLRQINREAAGRATVLRLHSLLQANADANALLLVKESYGRLDEISQIIAFQTLCLQLGSQLLEQERYYDAIACLQRIWPKQRLLAHQQKSLATFEARLKQVQRNPSQGYLAFQYEGLIQRIQREIANFESIPNFDAALRLRVATAYQGLHRYREAALVLEDMLHRMPEDELVKSASLNLIQCWLQSGRWSKALAAADAYIAKYGTADNPALPTAYYLRATALHSDQRPYDAELAFTTVHKKFPDHEIAARALFMEGICLLEQDLPLEAIDAFNETAKNYPDSEAVEDAFYWTGMALSFDKQHAMALQHMQDYLERYSQAPRYRPDAEFRIAHAHFSLADYATAIPLLRNFIEKNRGITFAEEAKLLLGDALGAEGKIDEAVRAYFSIDRDANPKFYEDAQFRIGNIYKAAERFDELRDHFQTFIIDNPQSPRLGEAVYWIGWIDHHAGNTAKAREAYWSTIDRYGPDPLASGIEGVLTALPKLYPGEEEKKRLIAELDSRLSKSSPPTLTVRITWAKAQFLTKERPDEARQWLVDLRPKLDPKVHHPQIIADIADALRESQQTEAAQQLYNDLRKWHPRAIEKDRAFFGLGMIAIQQKNFAEAMKFFDRFEKETVGSPLLSEVHVARAQHHHDQKRFAEAQAEHEKILELATAPRQLKAKSLLKIGELLVEQKQDLKASGYFERVYVSYGRYLSEVATAYWQRAQALDRLQQPDKAKEVYRELATRTDLAQQPEQQKAIRLLDQRDPQWRFETTSASPASALPSSTAVP